ncbi:hypothetical protein SDC9_162929 [bioreactor metagenome]|uniref:Uncharacterized protein n=1 Tax=bioreactor metagenome TaxID=1076179 RepID=A0A645FMF2_9ZZZZ
MIMPLTNRLHNDILILTDLPNFVNLRRKMPLKSIFINMYKTQLKFKRSAQSSYMEFMFENYIKNKKPDFNQAFY